MKTATTAKNTRNRWLHWQPKSPNKERTPKITPSKPTELLAGGDAHAKPNVFDASKGGPVGPAGPIVEVTWPQECIESEKRFGVRHARLFPLLGKMVLTPSGRGVLVQVFASRAVVNVGGNIAFVFPDEVLPIGTAG